jgi:hypothetical protein
VFSVHFGLYISYLGIHNAVSTVATDTINRSDILESIVPGDHVSSSVVQDC